MHGVWLHRLWDWYLYVPPWQREAPFSRMSISLSRGKSAHKRKTSSCLRSGFYRPLELSNCTLFHFECRCAWQRQEHLKTFAYNSGKEIYQSFMSGWASLWTAQSFYHLVWQASRFKYLAFSVWRAASFSTQLVHSFMSCSVYRLDTFA